MGIVLVGLEKTGYLINQCVIYEKLYISPQPGNEYEGLENGLIALYTAIFTFLHNATSTCTQNNTGNPNSECRDKQILTKRCLLIACYMQSALGITELSPFVKEIEVLEVRVFDEASTLEAFREPSNTF